MGRKKKAEEHENHERWLISYADFITLLFAFFVVMYSISSVNEGKFRVLSSSMVTAFSDPQKSLAPIQHGTKLKSPIVQHKAMNGHEKDEFARVGVDYQITPSAAAMAEMQKISDAVEHDVKDLVDSDLVNVHKTTQGVEIEIKSSLLFASGQARLSLKARRVLSSIARILNKNKADINVEGYTDNIPINSELFPSNWELSAARASSVVRLFARFGVAPERMKAVGYGKYRAAASNRTEKGRNQNRRVTIMVLNVPKNIRKRILEKKSKKTGSAGKSGAPIHILPNMVKSVNGKSVTEKPTAKLLQSKNPVTTKIDAQKLKKLLNSYKSNKLVILKKQQEEKKAAPILLLSPKTLAKELSKPKPKIASKISPVLKTTPTSLPTLLPASPSLPALLPIAKEKTK